MRIDILTLFPEMCEAVLNASIIGRARSADIIDVNCLNIRDYANNKHNKVDDYTYGGGLGMIMAADPIYNCFKSLYNEGEAKPHLIYLSPQGKTLTQRKAVELSQMDRFVLLCGHYEGVDQRVLDEIVDEEISIGDYVLTGGELPALVLTDTVCRLIKGVLADDECFTEESHFAGLIEYPQYTRPVMWRERQVPDVLMSGHHANIAKWRRNMSLKVTKEKRPDLLNVAQLTEKEKTELL